MRSFSGSTKYGNDYAYSLETTCSWLVNYVDYVAFMKSWEHQGVHSYRRISKFFACLVKARRRAALSLHSTAHNKLCNTQPRPYKPSHGYEYTGTQICHKFLLCELFRTPAPLCKQRTSRTAKERLYSAKKRYIKTLGLVKTRQ